MVIDSIGFRGYSCFKNEGAALIDIKPINVIIGRNNSGKSQLIQFVGELCVDRPLTNQLDYSCRGVLDEKSLLAVFPTEMSGGPLKGNLWEHHGRLFVGKTVTWRVVGGQPRDMQFPDFDPTSKYGKESTDERVKQIGRVIASARHPLRNRRFCRLLAERDIQPEIRSNNPNLNENGQGATNIIRKYLTTSNAEFPREVIQDRVLPAFNHIFGSDGRFDEIIVRQHEEKTGEPWEVYLRESAKGFVPLSASGSGLKTVLLVLLSVLVVPHYEKRSPADFVFAFEELENNLHPALLRRLLKYVEEFALREKAVVFLTTHASAALDVFGISDHAQIVHVLHDGDSAKTVGVSAHFDRMNVISALGAKPSDLLQANGVLWVEGPSDRIYLNRWIELFSEGKWREGRDYQCAFYGGALLARAEFASPEEQDRGFANLLRVNPNIVVICDSDRTSKTGKGAELKDRVVRIAEQVKKIEHAHMWITEAKEIENYLPGTALAGAFDLKTVPDPSAYEMFFPPSRKGASADSFLTSHLNRLSIEKTELAATVEPLLTVEMCRARFDLEPAILSIIAKVKVWNS